MSPGQPGDGYQDEVSVGRDPPSSSRARQLVGVAAACLVVGFLAGGQTDLSDSGSSDGGSPDEPSAASSGPIAAGVIDSVRGESATEFALPVFNTSDVEVKATIVNLSGWDSLVQNINPMPIPPGEWEVIEFAAELTCDDPLPDSVEDAEVRALTPTDQYEAVVPVVDASSLEEYHEAICAEPVPIRRDPLTGVWLVEKVYGPLGELEGRHLLRLNPDGTYAVDFKGGLFSPSPVFYGRYQLDGASITFAAEGGDLFDAGNNAVCDTTERLKATIRPDHKLSLASVRGYCADGSVWIARRILRDTGLSTRPPGTTPADS